MRVTNVRVSLNRGDLKVNNGQVLGYAEVTFDGDFVVTGIRIIETDNKRFVSMPSTKQIDSNREENDIRWHDICFPINKHTREMIEKAIFEKYDHVCSKLREEQSENQSEKHKVEDKYAEEPLE